MSLITSRICIFVTLLLAVKSAESATCGSTSLASTLWRIVGGGETRAHQYPWMTYLEIQFVNTDHEDIYTSCGGSLIDSLYVVSAAHCFVPPVSGYRLNRVSVVLGAHSLSDHNEQKTVIFAKTVFRHTKYNAGVITSKYDIALVQLSHSVDLTTTSHVAPICLPTEGEMVSKTNCQLLGWGRTGTNEKMSDVLKAVSLNLLSSSECLKYHPEVTDIEVCAGATGNGPCKSDAGSPLQCQTESGKWVLQGVTSYGDLTCGSSVPSVFTNVDKFVAWIDTIKQSQL